MKDILGSGIFPEVPLKLIQNKPSIPDWMKVAEQIYYHVNPDTKMNVPNSVYITTEKWYKEWCNTDTELDLFDWILKNKQ